MKFHYRLLNVFATREGFSGNPLCVFESGLGLSGDQMQALARQFNLSETTFILQSSRATAAVRIFTPAYEMPFAGHPTLGTAHVVADLTGGKTEVQLEMKAGIIPVSKPVGAGPDFWQLRANAPASRDYSGSLAEFAQAISLAESDFAGTVRWVSTGNEQLMVPVKSSAAVLRALPVAARLEQHGAQFKFLVFHADGESVKARFFFRQPAGFAEDPATGSACANLGGRYLAEKAALPFIRTISQGEEVQRPSELKLNVSAAGEIFVAGKVVELGRGYVEL